MRMTPLRPVDRWLAILNGILALSWLRHAPDAPVAMSLAITHGSATLLPALLVRLPARPHLITRLVHDAYPLVWLTLVWGALGIRKGAGLLDRANDLLVAAWDHSLFGQHLNLTWMPSMPWGWLSETMYAVYGAYYVLLIGVPLILFLRGCDRTAREVVLRLAVTYATCFAIYALFPVIGPMETLPRFSAGSGGIFHGASAALRAVGDSLGTAFPSSHTAGALALAWIAWRFLSRPLAIATVTIAAGVCLATVYTQNHFAVDTVAGVVVAALTQGLVVPWLQRGGLRLPGPDTRAVPSGHG